MLTKCCICIDLRTATLILALFGTVTHLWNAFVMSAMDPNAMYHRNILPFVSFYSRVAGIACLAGFVGVLKNKVNFIRFFAIYCWFDLIVTVLFSIIFSVVAFSLRGPICDEIVKQPQEGAEPIDMDTCMDVYLKAAIGVVVVVCLGLLVNLHFCLAIHSYLLILRRNQRDAGQRTHTFVFPIAVPAYTLYHPQGYVVVPTFEEDAMNIETDDGFGLAEGASVQAPPAYEESVGKTGAIKL